MIFSIFCYTIFGFILSFWGRQASLKYKRLEGSYDNVECHSNEFVIIIILIFFLFFGMRAHTTGVDTHTYVRFYESFGVTGKFERDNIEPAYKWLTTIYSSLNIPTWIFLGTFGIIQITFVLLSIRKQHFLYPYVCAYIILGPIFLLWANGMRQCLVECIFLYAINFIEERKLKKYIIIILVCSLMHKSAVILIPFYWILKHRLYPKQTYLRIIALLISIVIGQSNSWISNVNIISNGLAMIGYDEYADNIDLLLGGERNMAFGPSRLSLLIVTGIVVYIIPRIIQRLNLPKIFDSYFSLYFIGSCLYNIFANTSHIFLRPIEYLTATGVILVPLVLYYLIKRKYQLVCLLYGFLIYWYSTYVSIKAYMGGEGGIDSSVYSFYFLS